jgi:hypothetical protein
MRVQRAFDEQEEAREAHRQDETVDLTLPDLRATQAKEVFWKAYDLAVWFRFLVRERIRDYLPDATS